MQRNVPAYNNNYVLEFNSACRFGSGDTIHAYQGTNPFTLNYSRVRKINYIYLPLDILYYALRGTNAVSFHTLPIEPKDLSTVPRK